MTDKELTALLTAIHADAAESLPSAALRERLLAIPGPDASQPAPTSPTRQPQRFVLLAAAASLAVLGAPDRVELLEWLRHRPMLLEVPGSGGSSSLFGLSALGAGRASHRPVSSSSGFGSFSEV